MARGSLMVLSGSEGQPAAGAGDEELVRHLLPHGLNEVGAAAVHRDDHVGVEPLDLGHHLVEVLSRSRAEVKAANERVHLDYARDLAGLQRRIDDAGMAAPADHHEPAVLDVEAGGVLVKVLVGDELALQLGRREVARIAADPVFHGVLDKGIGQYPLGAAALDPSRRKGMTQNHRWALAEHGSNLVSREL